MLARDGRICARGEFPLQDWLVPVLYQQDAVILPAINLTDERPKRDEEITLPEEACLLGDYGFIGRERAVQALERARLQQAQVAFLVYGMAGVGKTTLAKGFLHWLHDTNGLGVGAFWFSFDAIRSAEYVVNELVDALFGTNARAAPLEQKLASLVKALRQQAYILVWDNFESASGIPGTEVTPLLIEEDRNLLKNLLKQLRGGKTKILITSRSPENWLTHTECYRLPLSGLQGEELWEYCNAVVRDLGLKIKRDDKDFIALINELDGHPLAIRAILLRLTDYKATDLLIEMKKQFSGQEGDESTHRILAALGVFDQCLPDVFVPILQLIGLHEQYVDKRHIEAMLKKSNPKTLNNLDNCFNILNIAGLLHHISKERLYLMHPILNSFLKNKYIASSELIDTFVIVMGDFGHQLFSNNHTIDNNFIFNCFSKNLLNAINFAEEKSELQRYFYLIGHGLAWYFSENYELNSSYNLFKRLIKHHIDKNEIKPASFAYHAIGNTAFMQNDYIQAKNYYLKSLELDQQCNDQEHQILNFYALGNVELRNNNWCDSENYYQRALNIAKDISDQHITGMALHQLGMLEEDKDNYQKAMEFYEEAYTALSIHDS